jgi:isoleucyl-tRNA synthetase
MDTIREAASVGQALRKAAGLRVRLPLAKLTIACNSAGLSQYADLIADELNVKSVEVVAANDEIAQRYGINKSLTINARALGPRVGGDVQRIIREAKSGNWKLVGEQVVVDGTELFDGEYELTMTAASDNPDAKVGITSFGFVLLDTKVTPELEREGAARDAVRHIQQARKDAGLDVSDRIALKLTVDASSLSAISEHQRFISDEVLAVEFELSEGAGELSIGESGTLGIELRKIG